MYMKVTTAVITTAGYSTRFLPVCKSIPKPMLPILEVPIIHELVKECVEAGIKNVILVTSYGNPALEDYFDSRPDLEAFLEKTGKQERYSRFSEVFGKVNVTCVRQNKSLPYGSGSAILAAKPWLKSDEAFAILYGDDMVLSNTSPIGQLKEMFESITDANVGGVIASQLVQESDISKYGAVKFKDGSDSIVDVIVEKPSLENTPSLLASYGRYIVTYDVFKYLDVNNLTNNELYFSEAVANLCKDMNVYNKVVNGEWLTTGDPLNYLKAQIKYAMQRDEYRDELKDFISKI